MVRNAVEQQLHEYHGDNQLLFHRKNRAWAVNLAKIRGRELTGPKCEPTNVYIRVPLSTGSAALSPHQRTFFVQWKVVNTDTSGQSAENTCLWSSQIQTGQPFPRPLPRAQGRALWQRGLEHGSTKRLGELVKQCLLCMAGLMNPQQL